MVSSSREQEEAENRREGKFTFCPKVNFDSRRLFEVPEDFDQSVALSDGKPAQTYILEYTAVHDSITGFSSPLSSKRIEWPLLS